MLKFIRKCYEVTIMNTRKSGILLPISALPSKYGIGSFSKEAYDFADRLAEAGQHYWQILPLGPTSYGDSPYASFSTFAGNPYFIDLEEFIHNGWLTKKECDACDFGSSPSYVDYDKQYVLRFPLLKKAYAASGINKDRKFKAFCKKEAEWLDDYALFMALKDAHGGKSWSQWEPKLRLRDEKTLNEYKEKLADEIGFWKFVQYEFRVQWMKLKEYCNKKDIEIIGDLPIYVAYDSADVWADPKLFQLDRNRQPKRVAGCPPDAFSATGQLWGNPLYDWKYHKATGYAWWIRRMANSFRWYDIVRIDHFRGFEAYYSIPFGDKTAEFGKWVKGPGYDLFEKMHEELGDVKVIAEDLGVITDEVRALLKQCGYPTMKVLSFAFDPWGSQYANEYLPWNYGSNCVVYTGTHDNDTLYGMAQKLNDDQKKWVLSCLHYDKLNEKDIVDGLIWLAQSSVANMCIIPMQDYLGLGNEARMNEPSTLGNNWKWRLTKSQFSKKVADKIYKVTWTANRCERRR